MRVLVTGASGWIGAALVPRLSADHEIRCLDVALPEGASGSWLKGTLAEYATCLEAVDGVDAVVHLAAGFWTSEEPSPSAALEPAVLATANLLDAASRAGASRFVLMSSCAVVTGYPRPSYISVAHPHRFDDTYGLAKSLQESTARYYARAAMDVIALRPWSVVDGRTGRWKDGRPLTPPEDVYSHDGFFGLICRHDVAEAVAASLLCNVRGFQPLHLMATAPGRAMFDTDVTERVLNWQAEQTFAELMPAPLEGKARPRDP